MPNWFPGSSGLHYEYREFFYTLLYHYGALLVFLSHSHRHLPVCISFVPWTIPTQCAGSVNMPINTTCRGTLEAGGGFEGCFLEEKGRQNWAKRRWWFQHAGLPSTLLGGPCKKPPKSWGEIGVAAFAQISLGAQAGSRCVQEFDTACLAEEIPECGSPCPQLVSCHRGWRSGTEIWSCCCCFLSPFVYASFVCSL